MAQAPGVPAGLTGEGPERTRLLFDARLRLESVDDAAFADRGRALTGRLRAGLQTGRWDGVGLLVELDATRALGLRDFNSTVNGRTDRPVVADPDSERVNRLLVSWEGDGGHEVVIGRQRVALDDGRFISNSGFRQNEQTLDAARVRIGPASRPTFDYVHAWRVNRTAGSGSPLGREGASLHLFRGAAGVPGGILTSFAYYQAFDDALLAQSNRTLGARYVGEIPLGSTPRLRLAASAATQRQHGDNPSEFSLGYGRVDLGIRLPASGLEATASFEGLGGDGSRGFAVPLTTGQGFQGFSGAIGAIPPSGLNDRRVEVAWIRSGDAGDRPVELRLRRHDFHTRSSDEALGQEWNFVFRTATSSGIVLAFEFADYEAPDASPGSGPPNLRDLRRGWITLEYVRR